MRLSLRALRTASVRLAALYVGVFAVSALILGAAVFFAARSVLKQQMTARIQTETNFLQQEFRAGGLTRLVADVQERGRGSSALDYLIEKDGAHLVGEMTAQRTLTPGWATIYVPTAVEDNGRPENVRAFVTELAQGLLLVVGDDIGRIKEVEVAIATAFLWSVGLVALLGIGGGALLSRAFLARVDAISHAADAIIGGDLTRRVPRSGTGDDLDRLAASLNRMLDRIGTLMDNLRQVSSDVAHDLRTPLSRLYQRLEGARAQARSISDYETAIDAAIYEAEVLLGTFAALLRIAQVEGVSSRAEFREVDLSALVEAVADAYRPDAEEDDYRLVSDIEPDVVVNGDQELLTQAVANLVENALRHTPSGTLITLRLSRSHNRAAHLAAEDDGPGVAEADLPKLSNRFFRAERSRTTPGNGLGLSLVAAVAELHGAALVLENASPGLRVTLHFPG